MDGEEEQIMEFYANGLAFETEEDGFIDTARLIAERIFEDAGIDRDEHEEDFDDFRYDVIEPALIEKLSDAIEDVLKEFPTDPEHYRDYLDEYTGADAE